jgi:hypothetical protein
MFEPSIRFRPQLEPLDIRANPGGGVRGGDIDWGTASIVNNMQTADPAPVGGIWVGGTGDGGRGGIGGEV